MRPPLTIRTAALMLAIVTGCGSEPPTGWDGEGVLGEYILYDGWRRSYSLHLPPSYDPAQPAPLLIMLHGAGDTGPWFQGWSGMDEAADEAGFITVYPNGTPVGACFDDVPQDECDPGPPYFWEPENTGFVRELIAHLEDGLSIDSRGIFAAGMSMGSLFTHQLACELTDKLAAVAPVASTMHPAVANSCDPSRPIPIVMFHGTEDMSFPRDGSTGYLSMPETVSLWAELNGCAGEPAVEWLPDSADDGTRVWVESYAACDGGVEVKFFGIEGGGHTWPGTVLPPGLGSSSLDISANEEILEFFARHSPSQ